MYKRRIASVVLVIAGVASLFFSSYIRGQVEEGRAKISSAQSTVDMGNKILSVDSRLEQLGAPVTNKIQKKIDEGTATADHYEKMANLLQVAGIAMLIASAVFLFLSFRHKNPN